MALVALLSAREGARSRPSGDLIDFGGEPLVDYQMRLAFAAGADRALILADAPSNDLAQLIDRMAADEDAPITLVAGTPGLARALAVDDQVLLIAENLVVPSEAIAALLERGATAMLTLPDVPATARFERIDAQAMWGGALLLPAANILATLDMLGDWDLVLTLLRRAVQAGIPRVQLSPEMVMDGRLTLATDQASADLALEALSDRRQSAAAQDQGGLRALLSPLSRAIVREIVRRQIEPSTLGIAALVLALAGLALATGLWMAASLVVMLLALATADLGRQAAQVTLRAERSPWRRRAVEVAGLLVLAVLGLSLAEGRLLAMAGAWAPLLLIALLGLADERHPPEGLWSQWLRLTTPVALLLVLLGLLLGLAPAAFTLLGLASCALTGMRLLAEPPGPREHVTRS